MANVNITLNNGVMIIPKTLSKYCDCVQNLRTAKIMTDTINFQKQNFCFLKKNKELKQYLKTFIKDTLEINITVFKPYTTVFLEYLFASMFYRNYGGIKTNRYEFIFQEEVSSYLKILTDEFKEIIYKAHFKYNDELYKENVEAHYASAADKFKSNLNEQLGYTKEKFYFYVNPLITFNKKTSAIQQCIYKYLSNSTYIICIPHIDNLKSSKKNV